MHQKSVENMLTILVERKAREGKERELIDLLKKLQQVYIRDDGYISSSLFQSEQDKSVILAQVTWSDAAARKTYADNPKRLELIPKIESLLTEPPRYFFLKMIP